MLYCYIFQVKMNSSGVMMCEVEFKIFSTLLLKKKYDKVHDEAIRIIIQKNPFKTIKLGFLETALSKSSICSCTHKKN